MLSPLFLPLLATLLWTAPSAPRQDANPPRILVVYAVRQDTRLAALGDTTFPAFVERAMGVKPDYYSEHIDAARFADADYVLAFRQYLRLKYSSIQLDLIVVVHKLALDMVSDLRPTVFPGVPVVFIAEDANVVRPPNSAGFVAARNLTRSIELALQLQPATSQVFVVVGNSARDRAFRQVAETQFARLASRVRIEYLEGLTMAQLDQRVAGLPEHSVVYYLLFYQDGAGVNVNPIDYLDHLASVANRPIYSWADSALGHGIVGGSLQSLESEIRVAATLASRVLEGTPPDEIPLGNVDLQVDQVDWRQLRRWRIADAQIPPGVAVLFREPGPWERYRTVIILSTTILLAQTALIVGLLVQVRRRRLVEELVRSRESELRTTYDRTRDLSARLLAAQEDERGRIARELHDDVGQQLALLALDLELLAKLDPQPGGDRGGILEDAVRSTQTVAKSVHDLSHRLHPEKLRLLGLVSGLSTLQRDLARAGRPITFSHQGVPAAIGDEIALCLYRIAQEALQNAVKHSGASDISVRLFGSPHGLTLTVKDNGSGFDATVNRRGLGLDSMRERLDAFDGTLFVRSIPGHGTNIEAFVPLGDGITPAIEDTKSARKLA